MSGAPDPEPTNFMQSAALVGVVELSDSTILVSTSTNCPSTSGELAVVDACPSQPQT